MKAEYPHELVSIVHHPNTEAKPPFRADCFCAVCDLLIPFRGQMYLAPCPGSDADSSDMALQYSFMFSLAIQDECVAFSDDIQDYPDNMA